MEAEETDNQADSTPPIRVTPELSQFIENMGLHYEDYGVPRIGGRILGLLLVSPRPITSEEMAEALQVSRSSISTNLKTLLMSELVEKVSLPGERMDYYIFSPEGWQRALEMRLSSIFDLKELAAQGLDSLEENHPARSRLVQMDDWVDMVQKAIDRLTEEWQSHQEVTA